MGVVIASGQSFHSPTRTQKEGRVQGTLSPDLRFLSIGLNKRFCRDSLVATAQNSSHSPNYTEFNLGETRG